MSTRGQERRWVVRSANGFEVYGFEARLSATGSCRQDRIPRCQLAVPLHRKPQRPIRQPELILYSSQL
jgi:hypothetical protein